ncbi:MAG: hypothetical protein F2667_14555 [Actinobacteria bacterium]|uniref:Unannotated protein n=1 Tax=freshwater metagenome TaxID=449393 RepID=A0A6J6SHF8_9ZZZZ|nr:hypothetical protein [Actinomycetota bacterium]
MQALEATTSQLHDALRALRAGRVRESLDVLATLRAGDLDLPEQTMVLAALIDARLARGDLADALGLGDELDALALDPTVHRDSAALAHHARGELAAALSDHVAAAEHYLAAGNLAPDSDPETLPWRAGLALALVRTGRPREAQERVLEHVAVARASGSAYALAHALRTQASVDATGQRIDLLEAAQAALAHVSAERLAAQIDTDLAGLLLLSNRPDAAATSLLLLRNAEAYAGRQEQWPLQSRVRRLLERLGEQPHRVQSEALASLTASERRVAQLAASGLTNRLIAAELVVTIKAVEWHLSHVYRKLGIASRTRLAATLGS